MARPIFLCKVGLVSVACERIIGENGDGGVGFIQPSDTYRSF